MKVLVDENIPNVTVTTLRIAGHDVLDIRGTPRQGMTDEELWKVAQTEARMLVTTDKGFSEHRDDQHHGLLILRLRQPNEERLHARVMAAFAEFPQAQWRGMLVVMRDQVRSTYQAPRAL